MPDSNNISVIWPNPNHQNRLFNKGESTTDIQFEVPNQNIGLVIAGANLLGRYPTQAAYTAGLKIEEMH